MTYFKWNNQQNCKSGDWIVDSDGDCYTIDCGTFRETYEEKSLGLYRKKTPVWAEIATEPGVVTTREGATAYTVGDYLGSNNADGSGDYIVSKDVFEATYKKVDG